MTAATLFAWSIAEIGDNFPDSGPRLNWSDLGAYGIAVVVGALVTAIVLYVRRRNDMTTHCDSPWKLFRELCQAHELDRPSQRLLASLARVRRYEQPSQLFVSPESFDVADLPNHWRSKAAHLRRLKLVLFDEVAQ